MSALIYTGITGVVDWIGFVNNRDHSLQSQFQNEAKLTFEGLVGETHGGTTRESCSRVKCLYRPGSSIRNVRQLSLLSVEEIQQIADKLGLKELAPNLLGASLVISGIPHFTLIPPSSRLQFASGATVTVDMENLPCHLVAREIEKLYPNHGKGFKSAAKRRRGVTAWVEHEGGVTVKDSVALFIPAQPAWPINVVG